MEVNRKIVIAGVIIMGAGAYHVFVSKNGGLTRVVVGGYLLMLLGSLLDLIGGPVSQVLGWLMLLAAGTAALTILPPVAQAISGWTGQGSQSGQTGGGHRTNA